MSTRWGWSRPEGKVYAVEVRLTCDGRGWFEVRCADGCCVTRYTKPELYGSEEDARFAARSWVKSRLIAYTAALAGLESAP